MEYDGDLEALIRCVSCDGTFTMRQVIRASTAYWPALHVVRSVSGCCRSSEEWQPLPGVVWRGYVYAAGTAHFEGMEAYAAPELTFEVDGDDLVLTLPPETLRIPGRR